MGSQKLASHPKENQPENPNNKKQHVSFLQGDTQQRRSSQSNSFRNNLVSLANWGSLANLEVLSPLSWAQLLWKQPSHFWRRSSRLARTILLRLAKMGMNSLEKEITRQWKSKCQHKRKRPRKRRRRT